MSGDKSELEHFLPPNTAERVLSMVQEKNAMLKITKHRKSKFGDYRAPHKGKPHVITVNGSLNPYAFLITFLHEFAHLQIFEVFQGKVHAHGKEWKTAFSLLLHSELNKNTFPDSLVPALLNYAKKPKASTFSDIPLFDALKSFDEKKPNSFQLKDLVPGSRFAIGRKKFILGELRRTRFICEETSSGKKYLVHKNAEVIPLS